MNPKELLQYRKGSTNDAKNCACCTYFVPEPIAEWKGYYKGICKVIMLAAENLARVRSDYRCNTQSYKSRANQ